MRILIVDDDPDIRDALELLLESEGHTVHQAANGLEALRWLAAGNHPAVILLDMMMPMLDGEGFLRELKQHPGMADIPVIILSGHQAAQTAATGLTVQGVLVKPVEFEELEALLHRAEDAHGVHA